MHIKSLVVALLCTTMTQAPYPEKNTAENETFFYVGTYTRGESKGIYRYAIGNDGKLRKVGLVAEETNPSFLAKSHDGKFLLAVNEVRDDSGNGGQVASYAIHGDGLKFVDRKPSGGASPCYVSVDKLGHVLTANYHSGTVGLLELSPSGELKGPLDTHQHDGNGTTARQKGPHAHMATMNPKGNYIVSTDLGTNELWFYKLDNTQKKLNFTQKLALPAGAGPRHLVFHPQKNWFYVINELSSTVAQIKMDSKENYEIMHTISTLPKEYKGENNCADIHISNDGKFLYASNRGHNSIAVFKIDPRNGRLSLVEHTLVQGDWPRNFALTPNGEFVLVANQRSNNIVSFKRDRKNGTLEYVDQTEAPSPVCLLF